MDCSPFVRQPLAHLQWYCILRDVLNVHSHRDQQLYLSLRTHTQKPVEVIVWPRWYTWLHGKIPMYSLLDYDCLHRRLHQYQSSMRREPTRLGRSMGRPSPLWTLDRHPPKLLFQPVIFSSIFLRSENLEGRGGGNAASGCSSRQFS